MTCKHSLFALAMPQDNTSDSVTMGTWPVVGGLLFNLNVATLSW